MKVGEGLRMIHESLTLAAIDKYTFLVAISLIVGLIVVVWIIADVCKANTRERTRREVAAYVAEGSITPEHACLLIGTEPSDLEKQIGSGVAWGTIKPEKAEQLIRAIRQGNSSSKDAEPAA